MTTPELQLARVEAGRVLRNPAVWVAFVLVANYLRTTARDRDPESVYNMLIGYGLVLPTLVVLAHVVVAVLRSRTSSTDGLLDTLPMGASRRTVAHLASNVAGVAVAVLWTASVVLVLRPATPLGDVLVLGSRADRSEDFLSLPRPNVAQILQGPLAAAVMAGLVVALVRWVPSWLVLVPLFFAAMMQLTFLGPWSGTPTGPADWLLPLPRGWVQDGWVGCGTNDQRCDLVVSGFDQVTPWWHLGYLVALGALFGVVAVLRHRRDRRTWWTFAVATAGVVGFVVAQCIVYRRFSPVPT